MATQETGNERMASESVEPAEGNAWADLGTSILSNVIVIGAFASFAVAMVGFLIDHYVTLVTGALLLAIVAFVWAVAATLSLCKIAANLFNRHRLSRRQSQRE